MIAALSHPVRLYLRKPAYSSITEIVVFKAFSEPARRPDLLVPSAHVSPRFARMNSRSNSLRASSGRLYLRRYPCLTLYTSAAADTRSSYRGRRKPYRASVPNGASGSFWWMISPPGVHAILTCAIHLAHQSGGCPALCIYAETLGVMMYLTFAICSSRCTDPV